jgi:hypothetical protein
MVPQVIHFLKVPQVILVLKVTQVLKVRLKVPQVIQVPQVILALPLNYVIHGKLNDVYESDPKVLDYLHCFHYLKALHYPLLSLMSGYYDFKGGGHTWEDVGHNDGDGFGVLRALSGFPHTRVLRLLGDPGDFVFSSFFRSF